MKVKVNKKTYKKSYKKSYKKKKYCKKTYKKTDKGKKNCKKTHNKKQKKKHIIKYRLIGGGIKIIDGTDLDNKTEYNTRFETSYEEPNIVIADMFTNNKYAFNKKPLFNKKQILFIDGERIFIYNINPISEGNIDKIKSYEAENILSKDTILSSIEKEKLEQNINIFSYSHMNKILKISLLKSVDITGAFGTIDDINENLNKKCKGLSLRLDYLYKMTGEITYLNLLGHNTLYTNLYSVILCLYYNGNCISSIHLVTKEDKDKNNILELNTMTHHNYQNRKFNKLLLAVIIQISRLIKYGANPINKIEAFSINPISAWLLMKNYEVEIDKKYVKYVEEKGEGVNIDNKDIINYYIDKIDGIHIFINLDDTNISKSIANINELLSDEKLPEEASKQIKCIE